MRLKQLTVAALVGLIMLHVANTLSAAIVYNSNVPAANNNYTNSTAVNASYTPTAGTNSVLVLAVSQDSGFSAPAATFGGTPMTMITNGRTAIFYLVNPGTTPGSLNLKIGADGSSPEIISYGTLTGVDTTIAPKTSLGVTRSGATLTATNPLTGLATTDYVLGSLFINANTDFVNFTSSTSSSNLAQLGFYSSTSTGEYTGAVVGGFPASAGNYIPSVVFNGGTSTGTPSEVGGAFIAFAAAAVPVPEPSTLALVAVGLIAGGMALQRRRKS